LNDECRKDLEYRHDATRHLGSALLSPGGTSVQKIVEVKKNPYSYQQIDPPLVIGFPEPMDDFDLDQPSHIVVELLPIHELAQESNLSIQSSI
jgi:hypothetical protein